MQFGSLARGPTANHEPRRGAELVGVAKRPASRLEDTMTAEKKIIRAKVYWSLPSNSAMSAKPAR